MRNIIWRFSNKEKGVGAIEYGLLAVGIAVAIIAVVAALGSSLDTAFSTVSTVVK